jgi:hypothetical protein
MKRELMSKDVIEKAYKLADTIKEIAIGDLNIPNIEVCICDTGKRYGYISVKEKKIFISNTITDINVFIDCIFHELRHLHQIIYNRAILNDYKHATCKEDFADYYNHPSEVDAREYAINMMKIHCTKIREIKYLYRRNML